MSSLYLKSYRKNVTSQNGEDGVLEEIFRRIGTRNKWCADVGASDGPANSNTWNLIQSHGWIGVLIESDYEKFIRLRGAAGAARLRAIASHHQVKDDLHHCLSYTAIPQDFDLLSIDVDGEDQRIWDCLLYFQPRVVVIEVDSRQAPGVEHKSGISSCVELGKSKGYELALHTGNCIFVLREYAKLLDIDTENWRELFDGSWIGTD